MADNVTVDTLSTDPVVASDDIGGVHYPRCKVTLGANGTNDGDVSTANPMPVSDAGGSLTVDGTVAVTNAGLTSLAGAISGTEVQVDVLTMPTTTISDGGGSITVDGTVAVSGSVAVTNSGITTIAGAVSGTEMQVDVLTMPTVAVTGTFYQATQPVSIASAVPVTDNSGSLTVDAPVATPVFVRLSDGSSAITTLPVSLASVPSHAVTNTGTFATQVTSIAAGDNNIGNVDVVTLPALPAGTNNIGDVDVLSLPALAAGTNNIGDVDVLTQPARSRTVDAIAVAEQTDAIMNGLTALTPKFAKISAAASGDNTLVAAVTSKKIRVLSLFMMSAGTVSAYIRDDAGTPVNLIGDATNKLTLEAGSGFVLPHNPVGWTETTSGEGLQLNLSGAIGVAGCLTYIEV